MTKSSFITEKLCKVHMIVQFKNVKNVKKNDYMNICSVTKDINSSLRYN